MTRSCHICRQEWYQPVLRKLEAGWKCKTCKVRPGQLRSSTQTPSCLGDHKSYMVIFGHRSYLVVWNVNEGTRIWGLPVTDQR